MFCGCSGLFRKKATAPKSIPHISDEPPRSQIETAAQLSYGESASAKLSYGESAWPFSISTPVDYSVDGIMDPAVGRSRTVAPPTNYSPPSRSAIKPAPAPNTEKLCSIVLQQPKAAIIDNRASSSPVTHHVPGTSPDIENHPSSRPALPPRRATTRSAHTTRPSIRQARQSPPFRETPPLRPQLPARPLESRLELHRDRGLSWKHQPFNWKMTADTEAMGAEVFRKPLNEPGRVDIDSLLKHLASGFPKFPINEEMLKVAWQLLAPQLSSTLSWRGCQYCIHVYDAYRRRCPMPLKIPISIRAELEPGRRDRCGMSYFHQLQLQNVAEDRRITLFSSWFHGLQRQRSQNLFDFLEAALEHGGPIHASRYLSQLSSRGVLTDLVNKADHEALANLLSTYVESWRSPSLTEAIATLEENLSFLKTILNNLDHTYDFLLESLGQNSEDYLQCMLKTPLSLAFERCIAKLELRDSIVCFWLFTTHNLNYSNAFLDCLIAMAYERGIKHDPKSDNVTADLNESESEYEATLVDGECCPELDQPRGTATVFIVTACITLVVEDVLAGHNRSVYTPCIDGALRKYCLNFYADVLHNLRSGDRTRWEIYVRQIGRWEGTDPFL